MEDTLDTFNPTRIAARLGAIAFALALVVLPFTAQAGTATGSLAVSASIANNCTVGVSTMSFGAYDPVFTNLSTALTATGSIALTCTKNDATTIALDTGLNPTHASGTTRAMKDGATDYLSYELYTTAARSTVWSATNTVPFAGTGTAGSASVYGTIPAGQGASQPSGSYTDTVGITVTF
jgi:spore coat protein U-like protein